MVTCGILSSKAKNVKVCSVQAVFLERVEILHITTKTKTLEVKGGFFSVEDMKNELGYGQYTGSIMFPGTGSLGKRL